MAFKDPFQPKLFGDSIKVTVYHHLHMRLQANFVPISAMSKDNIRY